MFTINIKGQRNPKKIEFIKLEMVFYKRGFPRVTKVLNISGLFKGWDPKLQQFAGKESADKNKLLRQERLKYLKIGERWEQQNKDWTPVELSHYFDADHKGCNHYISVSEVIKKMYDEMSQRERFKNGRILKSVQAANNYHYLHLSLEKFTRSKYRREFSKFYFRDVNDKFVQDYSVWLQTQGAKRGNKDGVSDRIRRLRAVFLYAKRLGVYRVNISVFDYLREKCKMKISTPNGVSYDIIQSIEGVDRAILTKKEELYLDLFMFSFYAGGMSPIDVCLLTYDCVKGNAIIYDRVKYDKQARVIIIDKVRELMDKCRNEASMNYVFPTINAAIPRSQSYMVE